MQARRSSVCAQHGSRAGAEGSALYGLLALAAGDRATAFALVRGLSRVPDDARAWSLPARAFATVLAERLTVPSAGAHPSVRVEVDGRAVDAVLSYGTATLPARALSMPGAHTVTLSAPSDTVLYARAEARYGLPWSVPPSPRGPLVVALEGPLGARDTRAALVLRVQNRGPRVLAAPRVLLELPAGAELDQPARAELAGRTAGNPTVAGRTLELRLRALAPGGFVRIPVRLRWSVGGSLRGLGVTAAVSDEADAPSTVLPSRVVVIPDRGEEPAAPLR